jgi:predicted short-subunit dehydrogenase-like oxidoreductase (DUF2520 family)
MNISILGTGRAGTSFDLALRAAGHNVQLLHHGETGRLAAPDLVLLCVPDDEIAVVAQQIAPDPHVVIAHVAGSRSLEILAPHARVASMHPLAALSSGEVGARRLRGATYCVAGDDLVREVVASLDGRVITLDDAQRTLYHATASVAANHLVALLGQVERLAKEAGLTLEDFLPLAQQSLDDVVAMGPALALTGAASRGDMSTIDAHLAALPESERSTYVAMANAAFELAESRRSQAPA